MVKKAIASARPGPCRPLATLAALAAGGLLGGCGRDVAGAWTIELPFVAAETCVDAVGHDFIDAVPIVDAGAGDTGVGDTGLALDSSEEQSTTTRLLYARVEKTSATSAVLILGEEVWLGQRQDDGGWVFTWSGEDRDERIDSHESGYEYTETWRWTTDERIVLSVRGDGGSGEWSSTSQEMRAWTEPDSWAEAVGLDPGRIPAAEWLTYPEDAAQFEPGEPVINTREGQECDDHPCRLQVTRTCEGARELTLTRARY